MIAITFLLVLILWFFAARWLARRSTLGMEEGRKKTIKTRILVGCIFLLPFADEIAGDIYMTSICNFDGG